MLPATKNPFRIDMPTAADEFDPPKEFIESLLASEVLPKLASFELGGCPKLIAQLVIAIHDRTINIGTFDSAGSTDAQPNGELRIRTRKTGNDTRVVWRIESLFSDIMTSTGFVGFDSGGDGKRLDGQWQIRSNGWIGKYNVQSWRGWT